MGRSMFVCVACENWEGGGGVGEGRETESETDVRV